MLKIAIVSNTSWSLFNFRFQLAKAIKKARYEVVLIAPYDEYSDRLSKEFEYYDIYMNNKGTNPKEDIKTTVEFYKLYKEIEIDIALHYTIKPNIYGTIVANFLGVKSINNITGLGTLFIKQNFVTKIAKWLYKYSQSKANKIFFQNSDDFKMFIDKGLVETSKCDVLPGSGVDTSKFLPMALEKRDDKFVFLFIARMLWDKGVGEYIESAKVLKEKYKNVEFHMLGFLDVDNHSAVSKEQMQEWVDAGYVNYLGVTDDVRQFIAQADCIILPSYREGIPRTLLESATMEKPIITTNAIGCKEVVDDRVNGYLCEVRSASDLALKMEMMLELSEDERVSMGKAGRVKMLLEFDESIVIQKYLDTIREIL